MEPRKQIKHTEINSRAGHWAGKTEIHYKVQHIANIIGLLGDEHGVHLKTHRKTKKSKYAPVYKYDLNKKEI